MQVEEKLIQRKHVNLNEEEVTKALKMYIDLTDPDFEGYEVAGGTLVFADGSAELMLDRVTDQPVPSSYLQGARYRCVRVGCDNLVPESGILCELCEEMDHGESGPCLDPDMMHGAGDQFPGTDEGSHLCPRPLPKGK